MNLYNFAKIIVDMIDDGPGVQEVHKDLPEGNILQRMMTDFHTTYVRLSPAEDSQVQIATEGSASWLK